MPTNVDHSIYTDRYVAFVDILGFSNIVKNSIKSPKQAGELAKVLERIADRRTALGFISGNADDFKAQSFSDCIVVSENASSKALTHLLQVLTFLALDLM